MVYGLVYPIIVIACGRMELARIKYDMDSKGGREALGTRNCGDDIWDGLELTWLKKNSSFLENNFPIFYYLVFQIHRFVRCVMFYIEQISYW